MDLLAFILALQAEGKTAEEVKAAVDQYLEDNPEAIDQAAVEAILDGRLDDIVLAQENQPTAEDNKIWFPTGEGETVQVPTYAEHNELKSALAYKTDNVYGGTATTTFLTATAGKTWHATLGTLVNNTARAACEQIKYTPDMQKLDTTSAYRMIVYGNNDGIGHALTQVSGTGVITFDLSAFAYKYMYIVVMRLDLGDISADLTDVLSISVYDNALPFALQDDLVATANKIADIKEDLFTAGKNTGFISLGLHADNLINSAINGATGLPTFNNESTRICNNEVISLVPNVPIYYTRTSTGYFNPLIYYFKGGVFQGSDSSFTSGKSYDADSARFLFFKNPNTDSITAQDVVNNFTIWQEAQDSYNNRIKALEGSADYALIAYGDSLTTGAGATDTNHTYWGVCAAQLGMRSRIGFGYGGSRSRPIAFTAGALSGYIPPSTRSFALKYADLTTDISINANVLDGKTVIIDGNEYTIGQTGVTAYTLPEEYTPVNYWCPVTVKNSRYTADVYVIWCGTNDSGMQWDIVDAMIAKLPHKRYVVLGLTRLGTDTSIADELKGYEKYGSHYLNIRMQIINSGFAVIGKTPTAADITAMNSGLMPPSLLSDDIHFNDDGYEAIGKLLATHIKSLGYAYQLAN